MSIMKNGIPHFSLVEEPVGILNIRKNTPHKFRKRSEKYSRKLGKILPKKTDPGGKITFSNYGGGDDDPAGAVSTHLWLGK